MCCAAFFCTASTAVGEAVEGSTLGREVTGGTVGVVTMAAVDAAGPVIPGAFTAAAGREAPPGLTAVAAVKTLGAEDVRAVEAVGVRVPEAADVRFMGATVVEVSEVVGAEAPVKDVADVWVRVEVVDAVEVSGVEVQLMVAVPWVILWEDPGLVKS